MTFFLNIELMIWEFSSHFGVPYHVEFWLSPRSRNLKYARYKSGRGTQEGIAAIKLGLRLARMLFKLNFNTFAYYLVSISLHTVVSGRLNVVKGLKQTNKIVSFRRNWHLIGLSRIPVRIYLCLRPQQRARGMVTVQGISSEVWMIAPPVERWDWNPCRA